MTRQLLFAIQYISIAGLLAECWVVFKKGTSNIHVYILLSCASTLVNNVGYLMQMRAASEDAYVSALQMAYLGKVWIPFSLFLTAMYLCKKKISGLMRGALAVVHLVTYGMVLMIHQNELYYRDIRFVNDGLFPQLVHKSGVWHYIYDVLLLFYIFYGLTQLLIAWRRETGKIEKKRFLMIFFALASYVVFFVLYKVTPSWSYDVTSLGYAIGMIFMYVAIFRYALLDVVSIARDYAIDEVSAGIIAVDARGKVEYYNKPALTMFPALKTDAPIVVDTLRAAIERHEPLSYEDRIFTPRENVLSHGGRESGKVYVVSDDTEHFHYVEELEEQTKRADSASKAKSSFLANMSHEIRTPINVILGMDELILRESTEPGTISYAQDIKSAGRTLLSIINDVLDLSKIEEGKLEILPTQYDLATLAGDLVNMTRPRAEDKGLRFDVFMEEGIPHLLFGDELRIRQCAMNVLTNAVKYTEKGSVLLRIEHKKRSHDRIALRFSVSDTGIGMKPEDLKRLFMPFARFEEMRNRSVEGTGLGMSITKQLLALMNSQLDVMSVYGKGSTFSFVVEQKVLDWRPVGSLNAENRRSESQQTYHELFCAPDARILVVDDMPVNLALIKGLLKRTRVQIDTAGSGAEAIALAKQNQYDAMFIDHMMPEMDGIETLHAIRELPDKTRVPCVALTANAISGAREMYLKAGFTDYLSKPVDGAKLEELLRRCLPPEKVQEVEKKETEAPSGSLPGWLYAVDGLDVRQGVSRCGTEETYLETLTIYARGAGELASELNRYCAVKDAPNAIIKVHALKSTSRAIGAEPLGAFAERLELAGKSGDTETLFSQLNNLITQLDVLGEALSPLCGKKSDQPLPPIGEARLNELYQAIRDAAADYDYQGAEDALNELDEYTIPESERGRVEAIRGLISNLDWDRIAELF
ncbi:MAG: response regulator [Oscillospiraceae bacterium]|nr:response regulator [Oscillospiraceae bacterium]